MSETHTSTDTKSRTTYHIVFNRDWDDVSINGVVKSFKQGAQYDVLKSSIGVSKISGKIGFNYYENLPMFGIQTGFANVPVEYVSIKAVETTKVITVQETVTERFI